MAVHIGVYCYITTLLYMYFYQILFSNSSFLFFYIPPVIGKIDMEGNVAT